MTLDDSDILAARILVVDDQHANVQLLEQMLAGVGYRSVASTTNPREVAPLHRREPFDLILLDLQMPGMDGFEVMEQLKAIEPMGYLPVLVVTAQPSHKLKALQAGAKDFVSKPFDVFEIQTRIRNMLEVRLLYKRIESDNRLLEQAVALRTAELRESEARFRSLVELASDWYWEQDEHGNFTKVSGPALEMLGLGDGDGPTAGDDAAGDDATSPAAGAARALWNAEDRAQLEEKLATRKPFLDFVYRRVNADGSEQFLQTSGEPKFDETGRFTGYRGIGMDVTGRMRPGSASAADADLQRFRRAMDGMRQGIVLVDRAGMRVVDANAAASRLTGYAPGELRGMAPGQLFADAPGDRLEDLYDRLIAGGADAMDADCLRGTLRRKDGREVPVDVHRQATPVDGGWVVVEVLCEAAPA
jgi:PAS domain S-box-containing protein